jgi:hypothetical protein
MKALCSWVTTDLAIPLRSGTSDPTRGRSTFGVTPCLQRVIDSISRRSEFRHDSAGPPPGRSCRQRFPLVRVESVTCQEASERLCLYVCIPHTRPGECNNTGVRTFYRFRHRHIFRPGGPSRGGLAWRPADRPEMSALVQSRSWERRDPLGNVRLHWPTSSNDPSFEERL